MTCVPFCRRWCGWRASTIHRPDMSSVADPRRPSHLVPFLIGSWVNHALTVGACVALIVADKNDRLCVAAGAIGLALQGILALTCIRNGIFLMHNYSRPNDEELELELQCASHLYVTGTFGFIVGPFYWDFLAWRALKFRMHPTYMFYFTVEFLLEDACLIPIMIIGITRQGSNVYYAKMIVGCLSLSYCITKFVIKKFCVWCPKIQIMPDPGEFPKNPTMY